MKILTLGGAMRDVFIQYPCTDILRMYTKSQEQAFVIFQEGKKLEVTGVEYFVGGGAVNSAVSFKRLGFEVASFFKIGNDPQGSAILAALSSESVSVMNAIRTDNASTGISFIIPCPSGERTVLINRGANITMNADDIPYEIIKEYDCLYITSLSQDASLILPIVTQKAKDQNKIVAVNPGTSQLTACIDTLSDSLAYIDVLMLNVHEANLLMNSFVKPMVPPTKTSKNKKEQDMPQLLHTPMGLPMACFTLQHYFHEVLSRGPKIAVVTNGAEGVYVTDGKKIYFHPSIPAHVVSTLGAGDAFASCFVAQLIQEKSLQDAICSGMINSKSVIQYLDTQTGLLYKKELDRQLKKLDKSLLQVFEL